MLMIAAATSSRAGVDLTKASIVYDKGEDVLVQTVTQMLAEDVERVTGVKPAVVNKRQKGANVIVGTLGQSKLVDKMVDGSAIKGQWERFIIKTIGNTIVVAGSDRRGTAYGCLAISEAIGVNPFFWWADVPVAQQQLLGELSLDSVSPSPAVKYRGIFINDEDWGLKPWSAKNYEKELGDIGPKTYAKVCELILRLKGNMLAPAMHTCTGAFYSHPESKVVADKYGIVITTSHCEPLLINNASKSDWDQDLDGDWDYGKNPEGIRKRWDMRLAEASQYENMYTTAMRGLHDAGLRGNYTIDEKVTLLERVIKDQRELLTNHIGKQATEIPQIFVPYKETMDVYEHGMKVPDDITLVWVDDNYGYMKRVSNPDEQKRSGRAGVYYHTSYLGAPHDYLWINTTPPVLMYEELKKAYDTGADRYWLLNVGDIKPAELGMATFFDMAWHLDRFSLPPALSANGGETVCINRHQAEYMARLFPTLAGKREEIQSLLDEYYRLAWIRKPEYMGWEREWDVKELERLKDTEYSFDNYNEAQQRLADYRALSDKAAAMMNSLPADYRPAFFQMIGFQCLGSYQMNRKFLMAQLNHELAAKDDRAGANWAACESRAAYDSIEGLHLRYNTMLGGKWNHMMAHAPAFRAKHHLMPQLATFPDIDAIESDVYKVQVASGSLEGCAVLDLARIISKEENGYPIRLIEGIGYDWRCLQLGLQTQEPVEPQSISAPHADYHFSAGGAEHVEVTVYSVPFWPLYKGRSNRFGVSVDGSDVAVAENKFKEYSPEWKTQVLQNSAVFKAKFKLDNSRLQHIISFTCIDPGQMIQRVVIDWGGLKKSYVGPKAACGL